MTFSGGEPLLQIEFLREALRVCKLNGYHTAVDTSGFSSSENFKSIMLFTDLFLYDIKHLDESKHYEFTGVSNKQILNNYRLLIESGKDIIIRIPIIPGYNDDHDHLTRLKKYLTDTKTGSLKKISLLPYHKTGLSKYKKFNIQNRMEGVEPPSKERMKELKEFFSDTGVKIKTGG